MQRAERDRELLSMGEGTCVGFLTASSLEHEIARLSRFSSTSPPSNSSPKQDPGSMLARMFSGDMPSSRLDSKVSGMEVEAEEGERRR